MRFDAYSATIQADGPSVVATLAERLEAVPTGTGKGLHGYTECIELRTDQGVACRVLVGGSNSWPHAYVQGEPTAEFVTAVRSAFPDRHWVTRADSAEDFDAPDAWDLLLDQCLGMAQERGLRIDQQGDWITGEYGRTFYVGSRKSPVFTRLYEKGKQQRSLAATPAAAASISPDWVRLEMQVRPEKQARYQAATATPQDLWGYSPWGKLLAERCFGLEVPRVEMHAWREGDDRRAIAWMLRQYGPHLERLQERLGTWEELGRYLGLRIGDSHEQA